MNRLLALTWKEFLQLKRDRMTLRMIVMVPILQTLIFGYAINYDVRPEDIVLDESRPTRAASWWPDGGDRYSDGGHSMRWTRCGARSTRASHVGW